MEKTRRKSPTEMPLPFDLEMQPAEEQLTGFAGAPLLVQTTVTVGLGVSVEASLSFLGLGVVPPTASWGGMLRTALTNFSKAPYLAWLPGLLITLTVLCLTLFGDGLDEFRKRRVGCG